jgi:hypothetical protein
MLLCGPAGARLGQRVGRGGGGGGARPSLRERSACVRARRCCAARARGTEPIWKRLRANV